MAVDVQVKEAVRRKKNFSIKRGKPFSIRPPAPLFPMTLERQYEQNLSALIRQLIGLVDSGLVGQLESLKTQYDLEYGPDTTLDQEDIFTRMRRIILGIILDFGARVDVEEPNIRKTGNSVSDQNRKQNNKVIRQSLGVDVLRSEPWLDKKLELWTNQNIRLIKTLGEDHLNKVEQIILSGFRNGDSVTEIEKSIRDVVKDAPKRFNNNVKGMSTVKRARLIARDQIGKLNGELTKARQQSIGVSHYIWRTSLDERVRPTHRALEGKEFAWNGKPQPPEGHPGEPINCRCYAEPVLEDILDENA